MKAPGHAILLAAALALHHGASAAALDALEGDGWYTWRTEAAEQAAAWCCYSGTEGSPAQALCDLDGRYTAYGSCGDSQPTDGFVQVYVRIESGETVKLRALSPSCAVKAERPIRDLGTVDAAESLRWLQRQVGMNPVSTDALAAVAIHRGEAALRYLTNTANGEAPRDVRENAIFFLGTVRTSEAAGTIERLMFADDSPGIRQHAAFVLAESSLPRRIPALIRQGEQDADGETRAKAWFWLARSGASEAEQEIRQAIAHDPDADVRAEIVSALSQLPGERAVDALIAVLADRRLQLTVREEALRWLAHSESDRGLAVVERLITGGSARLY